MGQDAGGGGTACHRVSAAQRRPLWGSSSQRRCRAPGDVGAELTSLLDVYKEAGPTGAHGVGCAAPGQSAVGCFVGSGCAFPIRATGELQEEAGGAASPSGAQWAPCDVGTCSLGASEMNVNSSGGSGCRKRMGHSCPAAALGPRRRLWGMGGRPRTDTDVADAISCPSLVCPLPRKGPRLRGWDTKPFRRNSELLREKLWLCLGSIGLRVPSPQHAPLPPP